MNKLIGMHELSAQVLQDMSDVTDAETIRQAVAEGHDAADFLIQNVVQAELNDRGNYGEAALCTSADGAHKMQGCMRVCSHYVLTPCACGCMQQ
jgi:hypothetical protein